MKIKSIQTALILCIFSLLLVSCTSKNIYKNRTFKYRVSYPEGYLALNSSIDIDAQEDFLNSIQNQNTLIAPENVDVLFCDPAAYPPHYRLISINTINESINIAKFRQKEFEDNFHTNLIMQTGATKILSSGFYDIGRSKVYQVDFAVNFEGTEYHSTSIILPFVLYPSHLFSTIYRPEERSRAMKELREMIRSFKRN